MTMTRHRTARSPRRAALRPGPRPMADVALTAMFALAIGCRDVLGIETRTEGPPLLPLSEACLECVDESCAGAERACAADPDCAALATCIASAGLDNPVGRAACVDANPRGAATDTFAALDTCSRGSCLDACYGPGGFFARYEPACEACAAARCLDAMRSCVADSTCENGAVTAYGAPEDLKPPPIRAFALAPGVDDEPQRGLAGCTYVCELECPFAGQNFGCVEAFTWPKPSASQIDADIKVELVESLSLPPTPLPGAKVEACDSVSTDCMPVVPPAFTDSTGHARFALEINPISGFRGFVRVTGQTPAGSALVPLHAMVYPIISDGTATAYVLEEATLNELAQKYGGGRVANKAHLFAIIGDCTLHRAPGMTVELPPEAMIGATTTYFGGSATGSTGTAAIFNVEPGCYDIVARNAEGRPTHRMRINAAPEVSTLVWLEPSSDPADPGSGCTPTFAHD